jgi:general secretion pathway protein G
MRSAYRAAAVVLLSALSGNLTCSRAQNRKEEALRTDLLVLRSEISQYTLDNQRPLNSLSELVATGYMKEIPTDPFTQRNDTWKLERAGDLVNVHSGSDALGSNGTRYSSW